MSEVNKTPEERIELIEEATLELIKIVLDLASDSVWHDDFDRIIEIKRELNKDTKE